jgi:hypothetical protein
VFILAELLARHRVHDQRSRAVPARKPALPLTLPRLRRHYHACSEQPFIIVPLRASRHMPRVHRAQHRTTLTRCTSHMMRSCSTCRVYQSHSTLRLGDLQLPNLQIRREVVLMAMRGPSLRSSIAAACATRGARFAEDAGCGRRGFALDVGGPELGAVIGLGGEVVSINGEAGA